ncbi:MAG: RusA family crossover junction endodeoxyribonuclease [Planctomycetota bacterium]|nr:RusA family crossover junction endodeoxyribonuclease [Planctomycetota bacterium]
MNKKTGRPIFVKSAKALEVVEDFTRQIKGQWKKPPITTELGIMADIYYPSRRQDLDGELLCDILQTAGVIKNDRQIVSKAYRKFIDKKNPRVELELLL